jgi:hypothetical protein
MIMMWRLIFLICLTNSSSAFATESSPAPLKLSPFPNGLEYKPAPEPSNTGNPLLSNTKRIPQKPKAAKPPIGARGAANNYGSVGVLKAPVGTF